MLRLDQYSKVKDNYCLCYFGHSDEYLVQLRMLKPIIEQTFKGLNLCFGCKDDKVHLLRNCNPVLKISEIKMQRHLFAHIKELTYNKKHPVEELLIQSNITNYAINYKSESPTRNCFISKRGSYPTTPLNSRQIKKIENIVIEKGYEISDCPENCGWVIGVESVDIFEAAGKGIKTTLIPTGIGSRLYLNMFPNSELLNI